MKKDTEPFHLMLLRLVQWLQKRDITPDPVLLVSAARAWPPRETLPWELREYGVSLAAHTAEFPNEEAGDEALEVSLGFMYSDERFAVEKGTWFGRVAPGQPVDDT